ncbi:MAG: hypothetical protein IJX67_08945 [Oscillospiraceae bacterium]|nr:hypothetical protein [Oscillospiraceae bacterium]
MIFILKRFIIAGFVLLVAAGLLLPPLAADTHYLLLQEMGSMTFNPLEGWQLVLADSRVLQFYLVYLVAVALLLVWVLVSSNYLKYRSDMQRITPKIKTPCAAGQGQFGTARWMEQEEIGEYFSIWKVPEHQEWFQQLLEAGRASHKEVKDSHVKID